MKTKALLLLMLGILATTGSTCINDGFLVAVNLPISACFAINPGPSTSFDGTVAIKLADQIDMSNIDKISTIRYYDIRVSNQGTYPDSVVNGRAFINNILLLTYSGKWSDFATPQTLLQNSTRIQTQAAGLNELVRVLNQFTTDANTTLYLRSTGRLTGAPPVPAGLSVCVEILAQVDAKVQ
jgi:hypothetical protein